MSDLPKTDENFEHIALDAIRRCKETFTYRNLIPKAVMGEHHDLESLDTLIKDTTLQIKDRILQAAITTKDQAADFLARKVIDLTNETARQELLESFADRYATVRERTSAVDRICVEDRIAIECIAEAMGIGEETRTAIHELTRAQEAKKTTGGRTL